MVASFAAVFSAVLFSYHLYLLASNLTTIEQLDRIDALSAATATAATSARTHAAPHPYDLGVCANIRQVCCTCSVPICRFSATAS